ncbi:MAG: hypothetical protein ABEL51_13525 [Salinibacter sp.]
MEDIAHFGFTKAHRKRLLQLYERFQTLAEQRPTRYRRRQLRIISTHRRLWRSGPWEELAKATKRARKGMRIEERPLAPLPTPSVVSESLRADVERSNAHFAEE